MEYKRRYVTEVTEGMLIEFEHEGRIHRDIVVTINPLGNMTAFYFRGSGEVGALLLYNNLTLNTWTNDIQ